MQDDRDAYESDSEFCLDDDSSSDSELQRAGRRDTKKGAPPQPELFWHHVVLICFSCQTGEETGQEHRAMWRERKSIRWRPRS